MIELGVMHAERARAAAPAVIAMEQDHKVRKVKLRRSTVRSLGGLIWRCYRDVAALRATPKGLVVLPKDGHKYDEVFDELTNAASGVPTKISIARVPFRRMWFDVRSMIIVLRTLPFALRTHRSKRLCHYRDVLVQSRAFALALENLQPRLWVIIGDLSPYLIALAAACKAAGHSTIYWQYSFLDFKHMPVAADVAVILNETGLQLARLRDLRQTHSVFWRPRGVIAELRLGSLETGTLAALLNVHADIRGLRQLEAFSKALQRPIEVRMHPNSKLNKELWPDGLTRAPDNERLETFALRNALIFGGNTQAQAKALSLGTPVVHCDGLDPLPFDHHGYVAAGILPSCTTDEVPDIEGVQSFFSSADYASALLALMGPEPNRRYPGLDAFVAEFVYRPITTQDAKASTDLPESIS